jgi:hypothetical protein
MYHDVLVTLEKNPLVGVCSPSLIGSTGVCPLTIMAPVPDICRHMSNVIARAEHEVFLATNYWMHSEPTRLITAGLKELSKKAVLRGKRVVVKIIYDRGSPKQVSHDLSSLVCRVSRLMPDSSSTITCRYRSRSTQIRRGRSESHRQRSCQTLMLRWSTFIDRSLAPFTRSTWLWTAVLQLCRATTSRTLTTWK